jgi:peptide-methionine (R)-S-oxide reductase
LNQKNILKGNEFVKIPILLGCVPQFEFQNRKVKSMLRIVLIGTSIILLTSCSSKSQNNTNHKVKENTMIDTMHVGNPYYSRTDTTPLNVSEEEWKRVLPEDVYHIARKKGTERAFTGKYWEGTDKGTYYCAACGNNLFRSDGWFASHCGWPSFFETSRPNSVVYNRDTSYGMNRTEVLCGRCGGHLGHLFDDGPPPTGQRFCMNSIVLDFEQDKK